MKRKLFVVLSVSMSLAVFLSMSSLPVTAQGPQPSPTIELVGQIDGSINAVAVRDGYAYVVGDTGGLRIINVTDPAHPFEVGAYSTSAPANDVAVAGNYAYVANSYAGLHIVDVSDPAQPTGVGIYRTPAGHSRGVAVAGNYAYVAEQFSGFHIVDVSDPAGPVELGSDPILRDANDVAVVGNYAYVTDLRGGLRILNVSDVTQPTEVGVYHPGGVAGAVTVAVAGNYAYVAGSSFGLSIVDVSDPAQPTEAGVYDTPGAAFGVAVSGDLAYVADSSALRIADVSDPAQPIEVDSYATSGLAVNVTVADDIIYVATLGGLVILRLQTPGPPPAAELVNGNFEDGFYLWMGQSIANGWAPFSLSGQPSFAGEGFTVFDGRWAYKISGYGPFAAGLAQTVAVQPGRTYQVTVYYQLYPPGDGQAFLGVQDGESATQWIGDSWPGVWRPLSQTVSPTAERLTITLQGSSGAAPNTNVYFDQVTLVVTSTP